MSALVIDDIGLLVTNDPATGRGPAGPGARRRARRGGRAGGGDRARARRPTSGSTPAAVASSPASSTATPTWCSRATGPRSSRPGWRASRTRPAASAPPPQATRGRERRRAASAGRSPHRGGHGRGGTTHLEIKSGYALDVEGEARLCRLAAELTDDVTFLGAHLVPAEYEGRAGRLRRARRRRRCSTPARRGAAGSTPSARSAPSTPTRPAPSCAAGRARGLGLRVHANQLGPGPGRPRGGRARRGVRRPLHPPDRRRRRRRWPGASTVATLLPAADFSTRQPYRRRPPAGRRRRHRGAGQQLQPGLELHDVDDVLHRPRRCARCT